MDIDKPRQQAFRLIFRDLNAVLVHQLFFGAIRQTGDAFADGFIIPSGFPACLPHGLRIIGVNAQDFLRNLVHGEHFRNKLQALPAFLAVQEDGQLISGKQLDLTGFSREGVRSVNRHRAAHAVKRLIFQRRIGEIRYVQRRLGLSVVGLNDNFRFRFGQRQAVVGFFRAAGYDGDRQRLHDQRSFLLVHRNEMAGHILILGIIDLIAANRIGALSGVCLAADGGNHAAEIRGQALHQHAGSADQRRAIVYFAGALGYQIDVIRPLPVSISGIKGQAADGDRAAGAPAAAPAARPVRIARTTDVFHIHDARSTTGFLHTHPQLGFPLDLRVNKAFRILFYCFSDLRRDVHPSVSVLILSDSRIAGRKLEGLTDAASVNIRNLGHALQHTEPGNPHALLGFFGHAQTGAPDAYGHGGGLHVQGFVFI